jgi:hypothetical protein
LRRAGLALLPRELVTYPTEAPVDFHYGWVNFGSAFAADRVLFNSAYHREGFLRESRRVLSMMPDFVPEGLLERIETTSSVFPVGIDFEAHREVLRAPRGASPAPVIIWNHRWEYDKDPDLMTDALLGLAREGLEFGAIVCGQAFAVPGAIERPKEARPAATLGLLRGAEEALEAPLRDTDRAPGAFGVVVVEVSTWDASGPPHALSYGTSARDSTTDSRTMGRRSSTRCSSRCSRGLRWSTARR